MSLHPDAQLAQHLKLDARSSTRRVSLGMKKTLLIGLTVLHGTAAACTLRAVTPAMQSARKAIDTRKTQDTPCPEGAQDATCALYPVPPQELARWYAWSEGLSAKRQGDVWSVNIDPYRGKRVQITAAPGGSLVVHYDTTTAYETLISRLEEKSFQVNAPAGQTLNCADVGLVSDDILIFSACQVSWPEKASVLAGGTVHFTLSAAADNTVELGRKFRYSRPIPPVCTDGLSYED